MTTCAHCGVAATLATGTDVYPHRPDLRHLYFWRCRACRAWVGCHRGGDGRAPLGTAANADLRAARSAVHSQFDPLWRQNHITRDQAYQLLATALGIPPERCHVALLDLATCRLAEDAVVAIRHDLIARTLERPIVRAARQVVASLLDWEPAMGTHVLAGRPAVARLIEALKEEK